MPFASVNYGSGAPQASQFVTLLAGCLQLPFVQPPQTHSLQPVRGQRIFASRHGGAVNTHDPYPGVTHIFSQKKAHATRLSFTMLRRLHSSKLPAACPTWKSTSKFDDGYADRICPHNDREELHEFYQSIIDRNSKNKTKAITLLETRKEDVIRLYHEYEAKRIKEYHSKLLELHKATEAWKNKKCIVCGASLRKVSSDYGAFWGCPNYRDGGKHTTFPLNYEENLETREEYTKVRIRGNWSTDLIRDLDLPSYVKASDMLNFLERNGLEDLRYKYGYKKSTETIGGYVIAKKASKQEEKEIENFLKPFFPTLLSQVGVRYKLVRQPEKVAIIDLIASDKNNVYIIEVKRESLQIKEEQLQLYLALLTFIQNMKEDKRNYRAVSLVYSRHPYDNYPWLTMKFSSYDDLKKATTLGEVSTLLKRAGIV